MSELICYTALGIFLMFIISFTICSVALTTYTLWVMWKEDRFRHPEGKPGE